MTVRRLVCGVCLVVLGLIFPGQLPAAINPLLQEGVTLLGKGQVEDAIRSLHDAERRLPDPAEAAGLLGEAYLLWGMQHLRTGDEAAAREAFAKARHYLPDDPRPYQGEAIAWLHDGQPRAAIGPLQEALAFAGDNPELWALLGRAWYDQGDLQQAGSALQQAQDAGATNVQPLLDRIHREHLAERDMTRDLSGRFTLAYAPGVSDTLAASVLDVLQDAYNDLGRDLAFYPESDIPVLLYAREDFAAVTSSPKWAAAVYDGKIRVPLGGIQRMTAPLRALLYHEYAHVVVRYLGKGRVPVWLNEGIAEFVGRRHHQPSWAALPHAGQLLSPAALERSFAELPEEQVPAAYQQSFLQVNRLVELCGWPPLGELLQQLGRGATWDDAVAQAYAPCGYDWSRLRVELWGELH